MRCSVFILVLLSVASPLAGDTVLLGDISYQPDTPITGLTSIFLDNFTDLADLGCSTTFPACGGIDISGTLSFAYLDSLGNPQNGAVSVGPVGAGSTAIYEFDPSHVTFESATLSGTISPLAFLVADGNSFISTGTFTSDILTPDNGFATISVAGTEVSSIPEPAHYSLVLIVFLAFGAVMVRRSA